MGETDARGTTYCRVGFQLALFAGASVYRLGIWSKVCIFSHEVVVGLCGFAERWAASSGIGFTALMDSLSWQASPLT